jgi:uncharacterized membrane protein YgdD (TMEM256/DUF423 family)
MLRVLIAIAALFGCAGLVLAAAAAHVAPGASLDAAGNMLLFHAPAVIAACGAIAAGLVNRRLGIAAAIVLLAGAALFSGDLALRAFAAQRLFPMAAPTGGTTMMIGWLLLALAAVLAMRRPVSRAA